MGKAIATCSLSTYLGKGRKGKPNERKEQITKHQRKSGVERSSLGTQKKRSARAVRKKWTTSGFERGEEELRTTSRKTNGAKGGLETSTL